MVGAQRDEVCQRPALAARQRPFVGAVAVQQQLRAFGYCDAARRERGVFEHSTGTVAVASWMGSSPGVANSSAGGWPALA